MKYIVTYQWYTEYNQFEGSWDWNVDKFTSLIKAEAFIKSIEKNGNFRNISLTRQLLH